MNVKLLYPDEIDAATAQTLARLLFALWPEKMSLAARVQEMQTAPRQLAGFRAAVIYDAAQIVACSFGLTRLVKIITAGKLQRILALCGVGVDKNYRGRNFGRAVVERQFARIANGEYAAAIFQTAIPEFYEKLGSRKIANRFINSLGANNIEQAQPFWERYAMLYPAHFAWNEQSEIDLLGAGY